MTQPPPPPLLAEAQAIFDTLGFTPVPVRPRADGWTVARQSAFLRWLHDLGSVREAVRMVGMTRAGAYALRRRAGAESFAAAWDAALLFAGETLEMRSVRRAVEGETVAVVRRGRVVGARRRFDTRLLIALLRRTDARRAAAQRREDWLANSDFSSGGE